MFDIERAKELMNARKDFAITLELEEFVDKEIEYSAREGKDCVCIDFDNLCSVIGCDALREEALSCYEGIKKVYEEKGYKVEISDENGYMVELREDELETSWENLRADISWAD